MFIKTVVLVLLTCSMSVLVGCDSNSATNEMNEATTDTGGADTDTGGAGTGGMAATGEEGNMGGGTDGASGTSEAIPEPQALYTLTFEASWSPSTHPTNFPSGPHFSGLTGATHNAAVSLWETGQLSSEGVRQVAELGRRDIIITDIEQEIAAGTVHQLIEGAGVSSSPGSATVNLEVTQQHPLVTVLSMVAPSPDWIVGVHSLDLRNVNGHFVESLTVDAIVYDAGTDSGASYTSGDVETMPQAPITRLTSNSGDTDFVDGLPRAGSFVFQKQQ